MPKSVPPQRPAAGKKIVVGLDDNFPPMGFKDENGNLVLSGRIDDMIKINGNRIEPSEVEHAVREVLGTDFAAVRAWERGGSLSLIHI